MKKSLRITGVLIATWLLGKTAGCIFLIPGPWGPEIKSPLPDGGSIAFRSRPIGRETDDQLIWTDAQGISHSFWVDQIHAGFEYVTLKSTEDGSGIWIESDGKVGASLDLATGDFRAEDETQHTFAQFGQGIKLAKGRTWTLLQFLCPY